MCDTFLLLRKMISDFFNMHAEKIQQHCLPYNLYESAEELMRDYGIKRLNETGVLAEKQEGGDDAVNRSRRDKYEVRYAELGKKSHQCIFKHIIVFTNDKSDNNKTLNNIREAVGSLKPKPELHVFIAAKCDYDEDLGRIHIQDDDEELEITNQSNLDTLVFARLGVHGESECEYIVKLLQDRGFLVLNPIRNSALACNKYESACLFKKGNIPQPNFCLMTKDILCDKELFNDNMQIIYPEFNIGDSGKNSRLEVVVKILDGHGGTGVFMCDCEKLSAILQTIFAISPKIQLLIQKKEEADGGDIRVHVLTLRNYQVILAAMKRVKLKGDFRSNVSLGAKAEEIKLTSDQEQIALKVAQISGLPWCAVDIMPLIKGSNPSVGDNVVLEINASPGTDGISDVIGENFISVLLDELDDPSEFMLQSKNAGYIESVDIKFNNDISETLLAKLDTGNSASAITIEVGNFSDDGENLKFKIGGNELTYKKTGDIIVNAGESTYKRPTFIIPEIRIGLRKLKNVRFACVKNRDKKSTNVLINRDSLGRLGYVVDSSKSHILTKEIQKIKII